MKKKGSSKSEAGMVGPPMEDDWQKRDDVHKLMSAEEVQSDPHRLKRAVGHMKAIVDRHTKKKSRHGSRSSSRH